MHSAKRIGRGARAITLFAVASLAIAPAQAVHGQAPPSLPAVQTAPPRSGAQLIAAPATPDSIAISVLTMGPGEEVFERFGHMSIRVHNLRTGLDTAYNWGMFDFAQPHFLQRFLTGDTRYWMQGYPTLPLVAAYKRIGRWVTEQDIALTPPQADSLWRFIQWNAREENKWYRYDYYRDNCATKVRDVLDMVTGGALKRGITRQHGVSYRSETLRLTTAYPVLNLGMDFALGRPADATLSGWEETFIPMRLMDQLRDVKVAGADGAMQPLVRAERKLVVDDRYAENAAPPNLVPAALVAGLGLAAVLVALGMAAARSAGARGGIAVVGVTWHLIVGSAGLLVLCLGLFTRHVFMAMNTNVLLATPVSLALAIVIPLAIVRKSERLVRAARSLSVFAALCAVAAVGLHLIPSIEQDNGPLLALAAPVLLSLAFAVRRATVLRMGGAA